MKRKGSFQKTKRGLFRCIVFSVTRLGELSDFYRHLATFYWSHWLHFIDIFTLQNAKTTKRRRRPDIFVVRKIDRKCNCTFRVFTYLPTNVVWYVFVQLQKIFCGILVRCFCFNTMPRFVTNYQKPSIKIWLKTNGKGILSFPIYR